MNRRLAAVVFVVTFLGVSVFTVVSAGAQRIVQSLSTSVGDLSSVQRVEIANEAGQVLLQGTFSTTSENPSEMERTAPLTSPGVTGSPAKGKAEIEIERNNGIATDDEIEVTAERLPARTTFKLVVDGQQVLTFMTTSGGKADLKLSRTLSATR